MSELIQKDPRDDRFPLRIPDADEPPGCLILSGSQQVPVAVVQGTTDTAEAAELYYWAALGGPVPPKYKIIYLDKEGRS